MEFNEYQNLAHKTSQCPMIGKNFVYPVLGLAGETGEFVNKIKKIFRDDGGNITESRKQEIIKELGDLLWYIAECSTQLNLSLEEIASINIEKLKKRQQEGKITGDGDNR